jgi:hypothetical protein
MRKNVTEKQLSNNLSARLATEIVATMGTGKRPGTWLAAEHLLRVLTTLGVSLVVPAWQGTRDLDRAFAALLCG